MGEGSRKHNELKQDMAGKMRTPCWHTEEGTEYIHCNYPRPFKKRSHRNNLDRSKNQGVQDNLETTQSSADGEEHKHFPESRMMQPRKEVMT